MKNQWFGAAFALVLAGGFVVAQNDAVFAQDQDAGVVNGKEAKAMLFSTKGISVDVLEVDALTEQDVLTLQSFEKIDKKSRPRYYGAIAMAPDEGLFSNSNSLAMDAHSIPAAEKFALKDCNSKRKDGAKCVVVAHILPNDYEERALQLSQSATEAYKKYKRGKGPKTFMASVSTNGFGFGKGESHAEDAETACLDLAQRAGAMDCIAVITDE
jgi:hypothetical protein